MFDDDFAEASIEAVSLAAFQSSKTQSQPTSSLNHAFSHLDNTDNNRDNNSTPDLQQPNGLHIGPEPTTPTASLRRLLSSLLPTVHRSHSNLNSNSDRPSKSPSSSSSSAFLKSMHSHHSRIRHRSSRQRPSTLSSSLASVINNSNAAPIASSASFHNTTMRTRTATTSTTVTDSNSSYNLDSNSNVNNNDDIAPSISHSASAPLSLPAARVHLVHPHSHHLWHLHLLSLPHNAIRAELIDLCAMLHSISTSSTSLSSSSHTVTTTNSSPNHQLQLQHPHFHLLREWFPLFRLFIMAYLDFETAILFPWVYAGVSDPPLLTFRQSMAPDRELITHLLLEVSNALTLTLPLLVRAVKDLVDLLLDYLKREQRVLPNLIQGRRTRQEAVNVERVMARQLDVALLLRWVPGRSNRMKLRVRFGWSGGGGNVGGNGWWGHSRRKTSRHLAIVRTIVDSAGTPT